MSDQEYEVLYQVLEHLVACRSYSFRAWQQSITIAQSAAALHGNLQSFQASFQAEMQLYNLTLGFNQAGVGYMIQQMKAVAWSFEYRFEIAYARLIGWTYLGYSSVVRSMSHTIGL